MKWLVFLLIFLVGCKIQPNPSISFTDNQWTQIAQENSELKGEALKKTAKLTNLPNGDVFVDFNHARLCGKYCLYAIYKKNEQQLERRWRAYLNPRLPSGVLLLEPTKDYVLIRQFDNSILEEYKMYPTTSGYNVQLLRKINWQK